MTDAHPPGDPVRDAGDAWVESGDGRKYWGRFGAAGLLVHDRERGVLLQHRAGWSHFGGTWGIPGGARHQFESAVDGAVRESHEEAGVPAEAIELRFDSVLDLGFWSYTTVIVEAVQPFEPVVSDPESIALAWVPLAEVETLPLHPGFADSWPGLRSQLERRVTVVVDVANVVGSRPDGWWKDLAGAAQRFVARLGRLAHEGLDAQALDLDFNRWWPAYVAVVEGQARGVHADDDVREPGHELRAGVSVVDAAGSGDDAIVDVVRGLDGAVVVVTSDRELRERVEGLGATTRGAGWLTELLDEVS
ncbi:NUDIX domain-containing protein [Plantibacter sp. CFBP 8804]|uniref:NUDIX domain-containing protein n=1 Tax=Plantibacter sp. CFBP 8804 TaxID=2775270 RepID=UPI00177D22E1|nr:NUDIX domain-containing protein [Plantibacter sp. CFBP 8804]MBD8519110.1 NUDIX domain-containing protein [Plantibacter sp. CFBP 8804]